MQIQVEVRDIEVASMKDGTKFHQVSLLENGPNPLKQFITWNVMDQYKDDIKGLKKGDSIEFLVTKIDTNYDGSLKVKGRINPKS